METDTSNKMFILLKVNMPSPKPFKGPFVEWIVDSLIVVYEAMMMKLRFGDTV